jgi:hypothetical protein
LKLVLFWLRTILGIIAGLVLGVTGSLGGAAFVTALAGTALVVQLYLSLVLDVDVDEHGGKMGLVFENFGPSTGLTLLVWMLLTTHSYVVPLVTEADLVDDIVNEM